VSIPRLALAVLRLVHLVFCFDLVSLMNLSVIHFLSSSSSVEFVFVNQPVPLPGHAVLDASCFLWASSVDVAPFQCE
jgi:hypothetical protein